MVWIIGFLGRLGVWLFGATGWRAALALWFSLHFWGVVKRVVFALGVTVIAHEAVTAPILDQISSAMSAVGSSQFAAIVRSVGFFDVASILADAITARLALGGAKFVFRPRGPFGQVVFP